MKTIIIKNNEKLKPHKNIISEKINTLLTKKDREIISKTIEKSLIYK